MDWTPFPELIRQYQRQIKVIDDKLNRLKQKIGQEKEVADSEFYNYQTEETLCSMRSDLVYGIYLMKKYISRDLQEREKK